MDLTQLANLGEFIGGVAVLVTLIYLAVQVRQSNQIATADAVNNTVRTFSTYRQMLADDSLSEVWAKAQQEEALSPKEKVQIHAVVSELAYASVAAYVNPRSAASEQGSVKEISPALVAAEIGASRVLREAWAEMEVELRGFNLTEFADSVSQRLAAGS